MGLKKVVFAKAKKHDLTYSNISGNKVSRTLMFHGSYKIKNLTGFSHGDFYEVYFDKDSGVVQIQRAGAKKRDTRIMRRSSHQGRIISGINFSFSAWPFDGFFPDAKQSPLEILKAEPGVLLFKAPRDLKNEKL